MQVDWGRSLANAAEDGGSHSRDRARDGHGKAGTVKAHSKGSLAVWIAWGVVSWGT